MSTIKIADAVRNYGGTTEEETLRNLARACNLQRIYKYRHAWAAKEGEKHTHYKQIDIIGGADERALFNSDVCKDIVLVYDRGEIKNL